MFNRSQDSNAMWVGPGTRDSSNFANSSQHMIMKGGMTFGRAPNTAGGQVFGSIGSSQIGTR